MKGAIEVEDLTEAEEPTWQSLHGASESVVWAKSVPIQTPQAIEVLRLRELGTSFAHSAHAIHEWGAVVARGAEIHLLDEKKSSAENKIRAIRTWSANICELGTEELLLRIPLTVTLEEFEDEYIASWPEIEAWGSGATDFEAINSLKDEIVLLYLDLRDTPEHELGKLPRRWMRALSNIIEHAGQRGNP